MGLAERLSNIPKRQPGKPCSVGLLLDTLSADDRDVLETALREGVSASLIYDALVAEGKYVGNQTINRHRSKACRCFMVTA